MKLTHTLKYLGFTLALASGAALAASGTTSDDTAPAGPGMGSAPATNGTAAPGTTTKAAPAKHQTAKAGTKTMHKKHVRKHATTTSKKDTPQAPAKS